jgi:predicted DNA-binding transcriptional regulator YafY
MTFGWLTRRAIELARFKKPIGGHMDRSERFHKIDQMLSNRGVVPIASFLAELQVSLSTFKRDIEYMRDRLNAPIVWDRDTNGYRFDNAATTGITYELPGLWFNDSELHALLTMQQLLDDVQPGLLGPHLKPLQSKLQAILVSMKDAPEEIAKRVRVFALGRRQMPIKHFETIASATIRRKRLHITHFNRATGTHTDREISPQQLVYYRDNWYLDCWCHLRKAIRTFSVDAIESAEMTATAAKEVSIKQMREMLGVGYGIFTGETTKIAKLKIGANRARWIKQTVWHSDQNSSLDDTGNYLLEIPYADDRELINDILSLLPDIEVIAPHSLRERLRHILSQTSRMFPD